MSNFFARFAPGESNRSDPYDVVIGAESCTNTYWPGLVFISCQGSGKYNQILKNFDYILPGK